MSYPSHYHNTTGAAGHTLSLFEQKAMTQDEEILAYFKSHPDKEMSPEDVWTGLGYDKKGVPLTSCRRSCTGLCKDVLIAKTGFKKPGLYGRDVDTYKIVTK